MPEYNQGHAFIGPSNTLSFKCPASVSRQYLVWQRNQMLMDYAKTFLGQELTLNDTHAIAEQGTELHELYADSLMSGDPIQYEDTFIEERLNQIADEVGSHIANSEQYGVEDHHESEGFSSGGSKDVWYLIGDTLTVRDLKTGYIQVDAEGNTQLMRYAYDLLNHMGFPATITVVDLAIDAVRFKSSTWTITVTDLIQWHDTELKQMMFNALSINPTVTPGNHCRNCQAAPHCGEAKGWVGDPSKYFNKDIEDLDVSEIEDYYAKLDTASKMYDSLKEEVRLRNETGFTEFERISFSPGRKLKAWKEDEDKVVEHIKTHSDVTTDLLFKPPALKTKTQLKQLFKGNSAALAALAALDEVNLKDVDDALGQLSMFAGEDELLKEPAPKTKTQLKQLFANNKQALELIESDEFDVNKLVDFCTIDQLLYVPSKVRSPAQVLSFVPMEQIEEMITIKETQPIIVIK